MKSLADSLPPDIAAHVHPNWRKNEAGYWASRDALLDRYRDQWVAFADGQVVASGHNPTDVYHEGRATGLRPFVTCVGHEHEPTRIRRATFAYDATYPTEAMPVVSLELRNDPDAAGILLEHMIADTGSDATVIPWSDCQRLDLALSDGDPAWMGGVGQTATPTMIFWVWALVDGTIHRCRLHYD